MTDQEAFEMEQDFSEDWPYCECGEDTDEGEEIDNTCASCGKPLC